MRRYVVDGAARSTEETRERERLADPQRANMIRKAAEVHRRVRKYARAELLKPGMPLIEICEKLENATRVYLEANKSPTAGTRAGVGVCMCVCRCVCAGEWGQQRLLMIYQNNLYAVCTCMCARIRAYVREGVGRARSGLVCARVSRRRLKAAL
jgi:hypothetical protein